MSFSEKVKRLWKTSKKKLNQMWKSFFSFDLWKIFQNSFQFFLSLFGFFITTALYALGKTIKKIFLWARSGIT